MTLQLRTYRNDMGKLVSKQVRTWSNSSFCNFIFTTHLQMIFYM